MKKLTIGITTYNRKNQLLRMLKTLETQGLYDLYNIAISDNCSNYDVNKWLKDNLSTDFYSIITIYRNEYNTGLASNLAIIFSRINTKWFWYLSDDDITIEYSLQTIINNIHKNENACLLKYIPIYKKSNKHIEYKANNLKELIRLYDNNIYDSSCFLFISNNVFNMEIIGKYIPFAYMYSYTYAAHMIPVIKVLENEEGYIFFSTNYIVKTIPAEGDHWSFAKLALGLRTVDDIPLKADKATKKALGLIFYQCISHRHFAEECLQITPHYYAKYVYKTVYNHIYSHRYFFDKILKLLFNIDFYCHTNILKSTMKILKKTSEVS